MGRARRISLPLPDAMLPNRKPPASLLRPKPRPARKALSAIATFIAGGLIGLLVGVGLQPDQRPRGPAGEASQRDPQSAAAMPEAGSDPVAGPAVGPVAGSVVGPTPNPTVSDPTAADAIRQAQAAEEARLVAVTQARIAAESRLAELRRDLAVAGAQRAMLRDPGRRDAEPRDAAQPPPRIPPPDVPREPAARREPPQTAPATAALSPPILAPGPAPLRLNRPDGYNSPGGTPRVVIHHRAGSAQATEAAATMVGQLREAGFEAGELRGVGAVPVQRVVRYFHTDDAPAAARLAGRLGRGWAIQDFRSFEPTPASGLLEVWLPER